MAPTFWTNFTQGIVDYGMSAYSQLEPWTYPLIFIGIIGFVYATMQSLTVGLVGILITIALYGGAINFFEDVPDVLVFFYIVTVMGIAMLLTALFMRRSR